MPYCPAAMNYWYNTFEMSHHQFKLVLLIGDDNGGVYIIKFFKEIYNTAIDPYRQKDGMKSIIQ